MRGAAGLALLALVLLAWFLWPFVANGAGFPVGPDGPVYLWWTRLAELEGLSAVGHRPGAPALALVLSGTLGISVVQATVALEVTLGVATGLAGAAVLRRGASAIGAWLGGLLAGTFAVHLAAGYLANLAFVPAFLAAVALLDEDRRRATVLAALALGAGGLAHPLFFVLGALILLVAAAAAFRSRPAEAWRLAVAAAGGGAIVGAGLLALFAGPRPPEVDTSKDAFLRRAGLGGELRAAYRERFVLRWTRYVQWLSVPLAFVGMSRAVGTAGRILRAWLWLTIAGVALALVTGWVPPDRFVTVGLAIPLLAALGLERVRDRLRHRRLLGWVLVAGLAVPMVTGSAIAWNRQAPFLAEDEVRAAGVAASLAPVAGTDGPIAFLVDDDDASVTFLASRAGNVIRASVPPSRIRDVVVVVPERLPPSGPCDRSCEHPDEVRRALQDLTASDLREAEASAGRDAVVIVLPPFFEGDAPAGAIVVDEGVAAAGRTAEPLEPTSAAGAGLASATALLLLWAVGFGWARVGLDDILTAAAAAAAFGVAALILVAVALDLAGVRVGTTSGAVAASALAGGGGYLAWLVVQRHARTGPPPQVQQEPGE
jgi:hypothetical protein